MRRRVRCIMFHQALLSGVSSRPGVWRHVPSLFWFPCIRVFTQASVGSGKQRKEGRDKVSGVNFRPRFHGFRSSSSPFT